MKRDSETSTRGTLNRRRFLVAGASGAAALGIGGVFWYRYENSGAVWIAQIVRKNLPGVRVDETSLATFVRNMLEGDLLKPQAHRFAVLAQRTLPWVTAQIPKARNGLEKLERRVLTEYLLGSNFFRVSDPKRETIVYYGSAIACANPFVTFA